MKKSTMKKMGSLFLACLMVVSTFTTLSTVAYAESNSYKTKINETFETLTPEELAELTADPEAYDISVFIEFASSAEELAELDSDDPAERREKGKAYHSNKNKKLKETLELENAYVSNLAPFAEIMYDSMEEYEDSWKEIRRIAKSDLVKDIDVTLCNLENESTNNTEENISEEEENSTRMGTYSSLNYTLAEIRANVGIEDDLYTGDNIFIGVIDKNIPDSVAHIPAGKYRACDVYDSTMNEARHARLVTSLLGGTYGIAKDAYIVCAATSCHGFLGAVEFLFDEDYMQIINMSMSRGKYGYYDNTTAYIDYISDWYNCLFVKSAGNRGLYADQCISSPGCSVNALTVGAMNKEFRVYCESSFKHDVSGLLKPDLVAPGENIIFHPNVYNPPYYPEGRGENDGTSFATPIVSGIAARLLEEFPNLQARELKAILIQSCGKIANQTAEHDVHAGAGLVNYTNAREIARSGNYGIFTKTATMVDGDFLGWRSVTIPAHHRMHIYFYAQVPGTYTTDLNSNRITYVYSEYQIGIGSGTTTIYYTTNHIVFDNDSSEELSCAIMTFVIENNLDGREDLVYAYDFEYISS